MATLNLKLLTKIIHSIGVDGKPTKRKIKLYSYDGVTWVKDVNAESLRRRRAESLHPGWANEHTSWEAVGVKVGNVVEDIPLARKKGEIPPADILPLKYVEQTPHGNNSLKGGRAKTQAVRSKKLQRSINKPVTFADVTDYGEGRAPRIRKKSHKHRCDVCTEALGREYKYVCNCPTPYFKRKHDMCVKVIAASVSRRRRRNVYGVGKSVTLGQLVEKMNKDRIA